MDPSAVPVPGTKTGAEESALAPVETGPSALSPFSAEDAGRVRDYAAAARAESTLRAYRTDWRNFAIWCADRGLPSLPAAPETVAVYLAARAETCKTATLGRALVAIAHFHKQAGLESPTRNHGVRTVWAGIKRTKGTAQEGKQPILIEDLRAMVGTMDVKTAAGLRDRALLLLGFATGSRRSELSALDVPDLRFSRDGLTVTIRHSKTDQEGAGFEKGVPYGSNPDTCPVRALQDYLKRQRIKEGPVFRSVDRWGNLSSRRLTGHGIWSVVKRACAAARLDPREFGAHSLRAGLVTQAAENDVEEREIMKQTGHRSVATLRKYIRRGGLFRRNVAGRVGL